MLLKTKKGIKLYINLDGESFFDKSIKSFFKNIVLKNAYGYFVAGDNAEENLKKFLNITENIYTYNFSSLTKEELTKNENKINLFKREDFILVVGRYFNYKGLDIALATAKEHGNVKYKFIGVGDRKNDFEKLVNKMGLHNIEVISFLQKEELEEEYLKCKMLILPSRKECWGLVINEAASYGTPIVSTYGSGAAVEFMSEKYSQFLAVEDNISELNNAIDLMLNYKETENYSKYLIEKSKDYNIEDSVIAHIKVINDN